MDEYMVTLDGCDYSFAENGTCILRGWMFLGEEEPELQVRADRRELTAVLRRTPRRDVLAALPKVAFPDENAGFEICITDIERLFETGETLRVRIRCGEQSFPLIQKSMEQVKKEYYDSTIRYCVEVLERRLDKVYLQGWCINTSGALSMEVLDENGAEQQKVHWGSVRRTDLAEVLGAEPEQCHGFIVEIPRDAITGKTITFVLKNDIIRKEHPVDMAAFDRENTRIHKVRKLLGRGNLKANRTILKERGVSGFLDYINEASLSSADMYSYYEKKHRASRRELRQQARAVFSPAPVFSIVVPLYHTPKEFLKVLMDSVVNQSYPNWQLCLADGSRDNSLEGFIRERYGKDSRICYRHLEENRGISGNTNQAIEMVKGDYVVFADHDDELALEALYENACVLRDYPEAELIYSDEDLMDEKGNRIYPHFKPDFNLDFLRCNNYICHLVVVKKELLDKAGGLREAFDGSQDYDFLLRCSEQTRHIYHIPKVLYHWRSHDGSTAGNQGSKQYAIDAGKRALAEHYERMGLKGEISYADVFIFFRTKFQVNGDPKVSILIPNKDHTEDLDKCVTSILEKSTWKNLEIIIIENNSEKEETFAYYETLKERYSQIKVVTYEGGFNYSAINNFGAAYAEGDYLLLLNNDTEVITPDWLEQMLGYCQREDVGIVGAKLLYPDGTVQHAGVVTGVGGFAGHILTGYASNYVGYMGRLLASQDVSAVTGACLMVKRGVYDQLGGLDEENFAVALNDVDFCLRARELGYLVVLAADVKLYHYESKSRGFETTPEKQARFRREIANFQKRHREALKKGDPYYNPNLTLVRGDCSLRGAHETVKGI